MGRSQPLAVQQQFVRFRDHKAAIGKPIIIRRMDPDEKLKLLTSASNQFRWALAKIIVAAICLALAAYQFVIGKYIEEGVAERQDCAHCA